MRRHPLLSGNRNLEYLRVADVLMSALSNFAKKMRLVDALYWGAIVSPYALYKGGPWPPMRPQKTTG